MQECTHTAAHPRTGKRLHAHARVHHRCAPCTCFADARVLRLGAEPEHTGYPHDTCRGRAVSCSMKRCADPTLAYQNEQLRRCREECAEALQREQQLEKMVERSKRVMEDLALENSEKVEELEQVCARWGLGVYGMVQPGVEGVLDLGLQVTIRVLVISLTSRQRSSSGCSPILCSLCSPLCRAT